MTPERWQQIRDVLEKALELAPEERSAYLNQACSSDPSLREEVETLLASSADVRSNFLQSSTLRVTLISGTKLGEYEVKSLLGSGGMGEVYRARDSHLGRDVAIKILPSFLSTDSDRLRRFEQEARAAAALNHPNILAVHQMGTYEGSPYMVSELLEGETLREQIKRGRLSAIDYGVQIARGLAAAHEKGIVHRDLKPENLFVTKDGRVKILDFGLAKLTQPQSSSQHSALTLTEGTEAGVVMGTVGYMAPEQVRGQPVDSRADIFAYGAILYEMLAGRRAFQKSTSADTMSAILNEDPPGISQVTANIPPALQRVVHRCLEKNPEQRFQSASDLAFALDALSEGSRSPAAFSTKQSRSLSKLWVIAVVLVAVGGVVLVLRFRTPQRPEPKHELVERQLTANSTGNDVSSAALSRDGKFLAYGDRSNNLYLLAIDSGQIRQVPLPARYYPADWFPDGNHLLLPGTSDLWKLSTWDLSLQKLWTGPAGEAAVSPNGSHIAFMKDSRETWLIGPDGEEPHEILGAVDGTLWRLAWSPTGQRLAYVRQRGTVAKPEVTIETCDLDGGKRTLVLSDPHLLGDAGVMSIVWLPDGRIIYSVYSQGGSDSDLWAIRADPGTGTPSGYTTRVAGWKHFRAEVLQASADGKRLVTAMAHLESGVYVGDLAFGNRVFTPHRVTLDDWYNVVTDWTKDSKAILFHSRRNGRWGIFKQNIDAKTSETLIGGSENYFLPRLSAQGALLYTATASQDRWEPGDSTIRLMSTPEQGGARSTLMAGRYDYACGNLPSAPCVLSDLKEGRLTFFRLDPVKGRGEEIAHIDGYHEASARWGLSPDGSRLAIVDPGGPKGEIQILNMADRKITILPVRDWKRGSLALISWAADGRGWFATETENLFSVDANGNSKVLYEMPAGAGWVSSIVPSPDGRSLAFTKRHTTSDLMLLENF
jgi:serine/threonine protein kinase